MRRQAEDPPGNGCSLSGGARPVTEPAGDVAAGEDRDAGERDRQEIGGGLDAYAHEPDIAAELASVSKPH